MAEDPHLSITRRIAAPRSAVWRCWTEPALLMQWYCPKPWQVTEAEIDLRPGGRMSVVMAGPEGERIDAPGMMLEVVPGERLVFTDAMTAGFIPAGEPFMVGHVTLTDDGDGTRMVWGARHWTTQARDRHLAMGYEAGWNAAADQLDALAQSLARAAA